MRGGMERLVGLPFSAGCISQSSVAVIENQPKKTTAERNSSSKDGEVQVLQTGGKMKSSSSSGLLLPLPKSSITAGLQRLMKSFKGLSQLFTIYKDDREDDDQGMEIGFPTDVKHVAHIGWDGSNNVSAMKGWDRGPELLALPSISFRQFELAMASQAETITSLPSH